MTRLQELLTAPITFELRDQALSPFDVVAYRGSEGLSRLYRFEIDANVDDGAALQNLVGAAGTLRIQTAHGPREFHGIVSHAEVTGELNGRPHVRLELVPRIWTLTQLTDARIQNKTTIEIVDLVMKAAGIAEDHYDFLLLSAEYQPREYCVQYRETDYNFLARLLEEEGIWFFFEQRNGIEIMRLADSSAAYAWIDGDSNRLPYEPPNGLNSIKEHVSRFRLGRGLRPTGVVLNDFDFKKPRLPLFVEGTLAPAAEEEKSKEPFAGEFYDYPGEYEKQSVGTARAMIRAEEFATYQRLGSGQSNSKRLMPGRVFDLFDHPVEELNGNFFVTSVTYSGKQASRASFRARVGGAPSLLDPTTLDALIASRQDGAPLIRQVADGLLQLAEKLRPGDPIAQRERPSWLYHGGQVVRDGPTSAMALGGNPLDEVTIPNLLDDPARTSTVNADESTFECRFECIPAGVTFRPARITPWPLMRGTQTAVIVGPKNEEIYTDEYGRVKVRFHWDRDRTTPDEQASCWIRVSQGWAGGRYGMIFMPRVGHEVIVDFLEGDPDKPIITGRVYNGDHMPPYALPDEKTKSTIKSLCSPADDRYHEIRFEDRKGAEQLFMRAQRRMDTRIVGPHFHTAGHDLHELVGGKTKDGPKGGYYRTAYENADLRVEEGSQLELIKKLRNTFVEEDATDAYSKNYRLGILDKLEVIAANRIVMQSDQEILFYVGEDVDANFIRITKDGVRIHGDMIWLNDESAFSADGIEKLEVEEPLEASPADDGRPGHAGRGAGGGPRERKKRTLDGRAGPKVISPKPPDPPPASKALMITAECAHQPRGVRRIFQRQVLGVVPSPQQKNGDFMLLTAKSNPASPTPHDWTISGVGTRKGDEVLFDAAAPSVPTALHNWYWNPKAGTKNRYHVTCKDGNGQSEWLDVDAFPYVRRLCLRDQSFINALLAVVKKVSNKLDFIPGIDFTFGDKVEVEGKAGWKEDADTGVSFVYDFTMKMKPIMKVTFPPVEVSLKKLAQKLLPKILAPLAPGFAGVVTVTGEMSLDGQTAGSYRDGRWTTTSESGGLTGEIKVDIAVKAAAPLSAASATGTLSGHFDIYGDPVAEDGGLGVRAGLKFSGLSGKLETEGWAVPDETFNFGRWDADANLFAPKSIYIPLAECGPPPPPPPPDPDPDPIPIPIPIPDKCPNCHDRHPNMRPKPAPCPNCHDRHPNMKPKPPPGFDPRLA